MRWTCPKCGKKLDISNEQLIANDGVIVCPQCLLQARQPVPKARLAARSEKPAGRSKAQPSTISFDSSSLPERKAATPPPHRPRTQQTSASSRTTSVKSSATTTAARRQAKQTPAKKKSRKKKKSAGMSAWGCLGRTIVFTLVLFAVYVFFGLLLEALQ